MADASPGSGAKTPGRAWADRHLEPADGFTTGKKHRLVVKKEVIPIVFVPGIMGSRLETRDGKKVWDPDGKIWMFFKYGTIFSGAASKKAAVIGDVFNTEYLKPIERDEGHAKEYLKPFPHGQDRGWTTVSWDTYGAVLKTLHEMDWGAPVRDLIELPVYAFGYNWTASCLTAGEKLVAKIEALIREYRQDGTRYCEKVILVTHSMGGLVARAACLFLNELQFEASDGSPNRGDRAVQAHPYERQEAASVLHCVHGVQPVNGGAAAYWRMKAGFERRGRSFTAHASAWVLGTDGREVTALLANMPGGLELLPNQHYQVEPLRSPHDCGPHAWLRVFGSDGSLELALPSGERPDPYEEIYLEPKAYWRLVDPAYLEAVAADGGSRNPYFEKLDSWTRYTRYIRSAKAFHADIANGKHASTTSFAGTGVDTSVTITFRMMTTGKAPTDRGAYRAHVVRRSDDTRAVVAMDQPSERDGDGTVPRFSGAALAISRSTGVEHRDFPGLEHEPAYKNVGVLEFTVEAIRQVCRSRIPGTVS